MLKILKNLDTVYNGHFDEVVWVAKPDDYRIRAKLFEELREELPLVRFTSG